MKTAVKKGSQVQVANHATPELNRRRILFQTNGLEDVVRSLLAHEIQLSPARDRTIANRRVDWRGCETNPGVRVDNS